ncbi:MAG TPA: hypothetical protein VG184_04950 [Acidimicrobiales bacterium]|nr:hypothetical protein [Acidimicrobiales bacterium]
MAAIHEDLRFSVPLYSTAEAARALGVSASTLSTWTRGYGRRRPGRPPSGSPLVTAMSGAEPGAPSIPFVGLAEALVLAAVRRSGVPLQRVRPALEVLAKELGVDHALASGRLYTDGAEVLFDYATNSKDPDAPAARQLVVVRNQQHVFAEVIEQYLQLIDYADDGYARLVRLPSYRNAEVVADPTRSFGQPVFARGGARIADVLGRFWAGDNLDTVAEEFGVPQHELQDVLRVASRRAA